MTRSPWSVPDRSPERPIRCGAVLSAILATALWLTTICLAGGCEHRITLQQFLAMQQQQESAAPAPTGSGAMGAIDPDLYITPYAVGPGDVLQVTVTGTGAGGAPEVVSAQSRVQSDGKVDLPMVEAVQAGDKTLENVEKAVKKKFEDKIYQHAMAHVEVLREDRKEVLVTGAVATPGLVALRRNERNVLFAIVSAGGVSSAASGTATLRRLRDNGQPVSLDLRTPQGLKAALALSPLESGDMLQVDAATPNVIHVGGLVNAPQSQAYPPGVKVTVLQALAASAGLRTDIFPTEATLIRRMPDGKDVHVKLDLNRISSGKDPNIELAGGDILWVPHTAWTRIEEWVNRHIYIGAGAQANVSYNLIGTHSYLKDGGGGTSLLLPSGGAPAAPPAGP